MGLNMCVDITDLANANSYGYTYPYESLGPVHAAISPQKTLNYDCSYVLYSNKKSAMMTTAVATGAALLGLFVTQL